MVKRDIIDNVLSFVDQPERIRNIAVIAHVDHGKSTLTDSLVARAGLIDKQRAGTAVFTMSRDDEKARGITIQSSCVTMPLLAVPPKIKQVPIPGAWTAAQAEQAAAKKKERAAALIPSIIPLAGNTSTIASGASTDGTVSSNTDDNDGRASLTTSSLLTSSEAITRVDGKSELLSSDTSSVGVSGGITEAKTEIKIDEPVVKDKKETFIVNLVDSPGHVDFSGEVTAALRLSDGCVLVVDAVEGVGVQTSTVVRQAISDGVKPVLFINKLDRFIVELRADNEAIYQGLCRVLEAVNVTISTATRPIGLPEVATGGPDWSVWPQKGNVGFGSGLQGWGFTIMDFAKLYHDKYNMSVAKMAKKLWGDNYYCPVGKKWQNNSISEANGKKLQRAFCAMILQPLRMLFDAVMANDQSKVDGFMAKVGMKISPKVFEVDASSSDSTDNTGKSKAAKERMKAVIGTWLPAADAMLELIVGHLPSPVEAMKYRYAHLYTGTLDDTTAVSMRDCAMGPINGTPTDGTEPVPLMLFVSKMVPSHDFKRFYAIARVFSGRLKVGQTVRIQGPMYVPSSSGAKSDDMHMSSIAGVSLLFGPHVESVSSSRGFGPGMVVGLSGVDGFMTKGGTISNSPRSYNMISLRHSVSAMVRAAVTVEDAKHLQKLVEGLRRLQKSDQVSQVWQSPTGEHMVSAAGELHLQVVLRDLEMKYMTGVKIKASEPIVQYSESVTITGQEAMSKSLNKLNRLTARAEPLGDELLAAMTSTPSRINPTILRDGEERRRQIRLLTEEFKWDGNDARKIWSFGPIGDGSLNMMVDSTKGLSFMQEIKEHVVSGFHDSCRRGVLCDEPVRGVRWSLIDAKLHGDSAHRGPRQLIPATSRVLWAAQLRAKPVLLEPMYLASIHVPAIAAPGVYSTLRSKRCTLAVSDQDEWSLQQSASSSKTGSSAESGGLGGDIRSVQIQAYLPVSESFGFGELLRKNTSGQAFPTTVFSHWQIVKGDLYDDDNEAITVSNAAINAIAAIRVRKGMSAELPPLSQYHDKL